MGTSLRVRRKVAPDIWGHAESWHPATESPGRVCPAYFAGILAHRIIPAIALRAFSVGLLGSGGVFFCYFFCFKDGVFAFHYVAVDYVFFDVLFFG